MWRVFAPACAVKGKAALMHDKLPSTFPARSRFVLIVLLAVSARAGTVTVTTTADSGCTCPGPNCTLRQAIATAGAGDTIEFAVTGEIKLTNGELGISRYLTITGPDVAGGSPVLTINADG